MSGLCSEKILGGLNFGSWGGVCGLCPVGLSWGGDGRVSVMERLVCPVEWSCVSGGWMKPRVSDLCPVSGVEEMAWTAKSAVSG